jgi:hypothetical protein
VTVSSGAVVDVSLPDDPAQYIDCVDSSYNDLEVFESNVPAVPGPVKTHVLATAASDVSLHGPELPGGLVTGSESLASLAEGCVSPHCSTLAITLDPGDRAWSLVELELFVSGLALLRNGSARLEVDRASARLYGNSHGVVTHDASGARRYELGAGAAQFLLSGASELGVGLYMVTNSTPLVLHEASGGWSAEAFDLRYVDAEGSTWSVSVPATTWN